MLFVLVIHAHASAHLHFSVCVRTTGSCLWIRIPFPFSSCVRIGEFEV